MFFLSHETLHEKTIDFLVCFLRPSFTKLIHKFQVFLTHRIYTRKENNHHQYKRTGGLRFLHTFQKEMYNNKIIYAKWWAKIKTEQRYVDYKCIILLNVKIQCLNELKSRTQLFSAYWKEITKKWRHILKVKGYKNTPC